MLVIRPIEQRDFAGLKTCAIESGTGMTSLPVNDELLQRKIDASTQTFLDKPAGKGDCLYFFVAEDLETGEMVGTCAIDAAVGLSQPFYNYHIGKVVHSSPKLGIYNVVETLTLSNDYTGNSELCTLFLRECAREGLNGRLLSKHRFLFMAEHPELFDSTVFAEMRGVSDGNGHSPFYEWLQKHFFSMDFPTVDYLTGIGKKRFIAELMPKYPIYVNLLSNEARAVIGQTHEKTRPAIKMLQDEGFVNRGYVDIFDAGPTVECEVKNIRSVRRSQKLTVLVGEPIGGHTYIICNARFEQYRACYGNIRVDLDKHEAIIPPKMAAALKVESGDMVRVVDLE